MELCICACAPSRERQWQGSKSVKLLLKVFPEATLCWTVLVFVVWLFGGVCCFVLDFFLIKTAHYSLFPDVHNILSLFFPLFPSRNVSVSWKKFLLGADQTEGWEIQNWGIFRMLSVVIFTHDSTGIIATTDVLVYRTKTVFAKCKDGSANNK